MLPKAFPLPGCWGFSRLPSQGQPMPSPRTWRDKTPSQALAVLTLGQPSGLAKSSQTKTPARPSSSSPHQGPTPTSRESDPHALPSSRRLTAAWHPGHPLSPPALAAGLFRLRSCRPKPAGESAQRRRHAALASRPGCSLHPGQSSTRRPRQAGRSSCQGLRRARNALGRR